MKKILLMFVVLITSIANAQSTTFDFRCATVEEEIAAIYTADAPPTELTDAIKTEANKGVSNFTNTFLPKLNKFGESFTSFSNNTLTFNTVSVNATGIGVNGTGAAKRRAVTLEIMQKIWIVGHPDYIVPGSVEDKIAMMYEANTPPTEFDSVINDAAADAYLNNNDIRKAFASKFDKYDLTFDTFEQRTDNKHYAVYTNDDIPGIVLPGDGSTFNEANFKLWMLEIAKAVWLHGHPLYDADAIAFSNALEAIYASDVYPTELGTIINDAALAVEFGIAGNTPRKNFMESLAYFNVTVSNIFDSNSEPSEAHLSNGNVVPNIGTNANTSSMNPAQFAVFAFEVVKRFWSIGHPEAAIAAKRAERIAEIAVLSDASANVIITDYIDPDDGDTFIFNVLGDPNLQPEYNTTTYQGGVKSFGGLGTTQWGNMKSDISDKITEINDDVTERNIRIAVLIQNSTTDVTVGARWSSLRGDLFDIDNGQTTVQIYANDYDLPLVVDGYTRLENLTHDEYSTLDAAIALKVGDLDPANAIYGFTPSEFAAASLQEKLDKAYDIAKANDDINAVSGSLLKGIVHGEKITLRIKAKDYPLEYLEEMANDANYEGWKTLIDRILYLVKTGDGSERTTRENHINGISNVSVTSPNNNDEDWAVAWNGALQFIYGGHDNEAHTTTYSNNNTSRRFAGYHQDNIGLLPGIIYEALLIEIDRINGYVVAADALRRHVDGGINKEREVGLKALTGDAAFHENASAEWFILNDDVTVWTNSKYGNQCEVEGYLWLGVMDVWSFRYMYIIVRNELLRNDTGVRYYNNVHQNTDCL